MTQYGPAAFRKSVETRTADRQQGVVRKVRVLLAALDKAEGASVKFVLKGQRGTVRMLTPCDEWQAVLMAAKALRGV